VYQKVLQYKDKHIWTISLAKAFQFKSNISLEGKLFVVLYTDFTWASVYSLVSSINIPEMSSNNSSWNDEPETTNIWLVSTSLHEITLQAPVLHLEVHSKEQISS